MSTETRRPVVVVVGMGETGVLTATRIEGCDVVGVATKRALVSGQELGLRLASPKAWMRDYLTGLDRFKRLRHVRLLIGRTTAVDLERRHVVVELADGGRHEQPYDCLVIATGVTNGFWRDDRVTDVAAVKRMLRQQSRQLAQARTIAVVGGGATGIGAAANLAMRHRRKAVHLFHAGDLPLPGYREGVRADIANLLAKAGVHRHPNHRAERDGGARTDTLDGGTIRWTTGQPPFDADAILWATGAVSPNSAFLPRGILDPNGFVVTEPTMQVRGFPEVFAIGDVAQTDANRSSARNWAYNIVAHNVGEVVAGRTDRLKRFAAPAHRWGSILGTQRDGLTIYLPDGGKMRMSRWYAKFVLFPFKVRRQIYGGVRSRLLGS